MGAQSHTGRTETGKCLLLLLAAVKRWVDNRRALGSGALGGPMQGRDEGHWGVAPWEGPCRAGMKGIWKANVCCSLRR